METKFYSKEFYIRIALGLILLCVILLCFNNSEFFGNYKSACSTLPRAISNALNERKMKKVDDNSWDYYLPCGYTRCESNVKVFKNEKSGKKIFMIDGCDWIASKVALWNLIRKEYGRYAHYIMPETFVLSDNNDKENFRKFYNKKKMENPNCKFILKNFRQRQEGLRLSNNMEEIFKSVGEGFKLVQDFLENPYIISGRKVNLRYYLLISCHKGQIKGWIFKDGFVYYTPKTFIKNSMDFQRTITTGYIDRKVYDENPLTLKDFKEHLGQHRSKIFDAEVRKKMYAVMKALSNEICSNKELDHHLKFQIFGADIAPDENLKCTLMEINKGPDIGYKDERDGNVKKAMIRDAFNVIDPLEDNVKHEFERIY